MAKRGRVRRAAALAGAGAGVLALALIPLIVILSSLTDAPGTLALRPPPDRTSPPPEPVPPSAAPEWLRPTAPPTAPSITGPTARTDPARAVAALARARRAIDTGMAAGEIEPRFGTDLANRVSTLLNEIAGGARTDLRIRITALRKRVADRPAETITASRAAALDAILADALAGNPP